MSGVTDGTARSPTIGEVYLAAVRGSLMSRPDSFISIRSWKRSQIWTGIILRFAMKWKTWCDFGLIWAWTACELMRFGAFRKTLSLVTIHQILISTAILKPTARSFTTTVKWGRIFRNTCVSWRRFAMNMTISRWCLNFIRTRSWAIFGHSIMKLFRRIQKVRHFSWNIGKMIGMASVQAGILSIICKPAVITCRFSVLAITISRALGHA